MRTLSALLLLCLLSPIALAQCPGGRCPTPSWSPVQTSQARIPDYAIKSTVQISQDLGGHSNGGTGTVVDYDPETKTCCVLTCRHVVTSTTAPVYVTTYHGSKIKASYLGASTSGADIVVLEIPSIDSAGNYLIEVYTPIARTALQPGESICQCGWGGGHFNQRVGRFLGRNSYSTPGGRNESWRFHWNDTASFAAISGDSGSGVFAVDRPELVGVLWGGDDRNSKYCGADYCQEAYELCFRKRPRRHPGGGSGGGGIPVIPGNPGAPGTPPAPTISTPPAGPGKPAIDPSAGKLDELGQAMAKLTGTVSAQSAQLNTIDTRLAAAEKARCSCAGASTTSTAPPSAFKDSDIAQMQKTLGLLTQHADKQLQITGNLTAQVDQLSKSVSSLSDRLTTLENKPASEAPRILSRIEAIGK